jgi:hypothetical protein
MWTYINAVSAKLAQDYNLGLSAVNDAIWAHLMRCYDGGYDVSATAFVIACDIQSHAGEHGQ